MHGADPKKLCLHCEKVTRQRASLFLLLPIILCVALRMCHKAIECELQVHRLVPLAPQLSRGSVSHRHCQPGAPADRPQVRSTLASVSRILSTLKIGPPLATRCLGCIACIA